MLYPIKFKPIFKERIWGGQRLGQTMAKRLPAGVSVGESWELSGVDGNLSVVSNGLLKGNDIEEMVEIFMGELVGEEVYDKFGLDFPLLVKFIDAESDLSIQVHPNDEIAGERHNSYGKTEFWYIVDAEPDAAIYLGFNRDVTCEEFLDSVSNGTLVSLLNKINVRKGDAFEIPAGTVHAMGSGIVVVEIQQTSDVTYRIYDWGRVDSEGKPRELHLDDALDAIDYGRFDLDRHSSKAAPKGENCVTRLAENPYFSINMVEYHGEAVRDYSDLDSFVIYTNIDGESAVGFSKGYESLTKGDTMLIPAQEDTIYLRGRGLLLEIYIDRTRASASMK